MITIKNRTAVCLLFAFALIELHLLADSASTLHLTNTGQGPAGSVPPLRFRDLASQAGLTFIPRSRADRRYVLDTMAGGGVALLDCDNDGNLDIAVVNDSTIEQNLRGGDLMVTLYRQDGKRPTPHFTDVTKT